MRLPYAVGPSQIYLADAFNYQIYRYDSTGRLLTRFGSATWASSSRTEGDLQASADDHGTRQSTSKWKGLARHT